MDNHGRNQAYQAIATADGQRTAPQALLATWLSAIMLTIAVGQNVLAQDAKPPAVNRRAKSQLSEVSVAESASHASGSSAGLRQPDFATPVGGVAEEPPTDKTPAASGSKARDKASSEAARKAFSTTAEKKSKPAGKPEATWSSLWREVFAADASPAANALPDDKADAANGSYLERLASHTSSGADEFFQRPTPPKNPHPSEEEEEVAPPTDAIQEPPPEAGAPRLFKLAETVVESGSRSGVLGLSRQMAMRSDAPPAAEMPEAAAAPSQQTTEGRYGLDNSSLLQPFRATNPAAASRGAASHAYGEASSQASQSVFYASPISTLAGQLTMSTTNNYRSLSESVADSPMLSDQAEGDGSWSFSVPTMTNPFTMTQDPSSEGPRLAAYQETLPAPPDPEGDDEDPFNQGSEQRGDGESKTLADAEKVGEEPEDNTLQFLRTQTVLLEPGESQCDIGINYLFSENRFPILLLDGGVPIGADDVLFRIRELTFPLEYRVGLLKRVQAFIGAPIGWSNTQVALGDYEQFESDGGFGDLDFGTTIQVIEGNAECPHGLFTISVTAPTGGDPFGPVALLAQSAPSLGQGFWSISANALCIQTYDPMVFFYGVGAEHFFSRYFNEREIELGNSWNYLFGAGFAVNDRVTLSTRFFGSYIEETRVNRRRVLGSNIEPMTIRMAATISKPCDRLVEPFVEFGITDSAVESFIGITWTY